MKYILLSDFDIVEDFDDGMYFVRPHMAGEMEGESAPMEGFSDGDLYHIRRYAPPEADSIAMTDDWMFYNTVNGMLFDYVFK